MGSGLDFLFWRPLRAAVAAGLVLAAAGCFRAAKDPESFYGPYTGAAPLTIRGAAPGQAEADVVALLGAPDRRSGAGYGVESLQWQRLPDMVVTFDARAGRVTEVLGNELTGDGKAVLTPGMSEADVRAVLGKPAKSVGHYRPKGSGVISIGMTRDSTTLTWRRDGREIEATLNEGALAFIRLRPVS